MPKRSRGRRFKGTPAWKRAKQSEELAESANVCEPSTDDPMDVSPDLGQAGCSFVDSTASEISQDSTCDTDSLNESVSEKKLKHSKTLAECDVSSYTMADKRTGYRLIDLECLNEALAVAHKCKQGGIIIEEDFTQRQGLCSTLVIRCTKCNHKTPFQTSKRNPGVGKSYEVNRRAAFAMGELGHSREAMLDFCCAFDMPPPSASPGWSFHNKTLHKAAKEAFPEECIAAGKRLRDMLKLEDTSIEDDSIIDVTVSFDGTWHHRGFRSTHGVGVVMSVDTGEVIDAVVLSKECVECNRMAKKDPESDDFMIWEFHHFEGGFCRSNYDGPSSGMEQKAAELTWKRSISMHNMRYKYMLCDGDSKALNDLNDVHKPYGDIS